MSLLSLQVNRFTSRHVILPPRHVRQCYFLLTILLMLQEHGASCQSTAPSPPMQPGSSWLDLTSQSSTATSSTVGFGEVPSRAVDGVRAENTPNVNCFATACGQPGPQWWQIDLGATHLVQTVRVTSGICCNSRINGFNVLVDGQACASNVQLSDYGVPDYGCTTELCDANVPGTAPSMDVSCGMSGSVLRIERPGASYGCNQLEICEVEVLVGPSSPDPPPPASPPAPPTTFYIRGSRSQIVFGTSDECTLELASGATSLTSTCPINTPSSRRLEDASNDSDRIAQLETKIAQLEMDKAEMKEQLQFITTELKMLKEQRKAP